MKVANKPQTRIATPEAIAKYNTTASRCDCYDRNNRGGSQYDEIQKDCCCYHMLTVRNQIRTQGIIDPTKTVRQVPPVDLTFAHQLLYGEQQAEVPETAAVDARIEAPALPGSKGDTKPEPPTVAPERPDMNLRSLTERLTASGKFQTSRKAFEQAVELYEAAQAAGVRLDVFLAQSPLGEIALARTPIYTVHTFSGPVFCGCPGGKSCAHVRAHQAGIKDGTYLTDSHEADIRLLIADYDKRAELFSTRQPIVEPVGADPDQMSLSEWLEADAAAKRAKGLYIEGEDNDRAAELIEAVTEGQGVSLDQKVGLLPWAKHRIKVRRLADSLPQMDIVDYLNSKVQPVTVNLLDLAPTEIQVIADQLQNAWLDDMTPTYDDGPDPFYFMAEEEVLLGSEDGDIIGFPLAC